MEAWPVDMNDHPAAELRSHVVEFPDNRLAASLFGELDSHLKLMEHRLGVQLHPIGNTVVITASWQLVEKARILLETLYESLKRGQFVDQQCVEAGIRALCDTGGVRDVFAPENVIRTPRRTIQARTLRQADYIQTLGRSELTFAIGPAGTGKTYLAVASAVARFQEGSVSRIILTRPAVEAGERLGFLPGDLQAKIDPYLRPLFDSLQDTLGADRMEKMVSRNALEVAPLAYMRGRTLEEAFIILDEAQNVTPEQMKMFLTRLGTGSRTVVCGDATQIDLPRGTRSGLIDAMDILKHVEGIAWIHFSEHDVVRHPLVRSIVQAYDRAGRQQWKNGGSV
ncbi:MAG: PhoH family protein [Magnetococcales bacterium]|nr:PhoH family protein [Magnetococcales bacterium]